MTHHCSTMYLKIKVNDTHKKTENTQNNQLYKNGQRSYKLTHIKEENL